MLQMIKDWVAQKRLMYRALYEEKMIEYEEKQKKKAR